jgi:CheY-like chemotaxis protein
MDIQMPILDGYETTKQIRAHEDILISTIPIIALTAHASSSEAEKCLNLGMNAYLAKPFNAEQLKKEILRILNQNKIIVETVHNLNYLKEHAEGDVVFLKEMVDIFFNETPQLLLELSQNIDDEDFKKIKITSHSMKGIFLTFGINEAGFLIKDIENLAIEGHNLEQIKINFNLISELYKQAKKDIEIELKNN